MTVRDYYLPRSLPEALDLVGTHGSGLLVMAGGTVAMPLINEGLSLPEAVVRMLPGSALTKSLGTALVASHDA